MCGRGGGLRRRVGGVSGTSLINVSLTGRLISLRVSSPFLRAEDGAPLIVLQFGLIGRWGGRFHFKMSSL